MSSLQVDTAAEWSASAHRRATMDYLKKEHINFIEPHMWPPNSRGLRYLGYSSATSLTPPTIQDGGRTEASDSHRVVKTLTVFH